MEKQKIAFISDIHSNYVLLCQTLDDIKRRNIDTVIFLGDYISDGFQNNEVINEIKKQKYIIAGNRDVLIANYDGHSWDNVDQFKSMLYAYNDITEENKNYLKELPLFKIINLGERKLCVSHGTPYNCTDLVCKDSYDLFDKLIEDYDCDVYLSGHTHIGLYTKYRDRLFINPGSLVLSSETPTSKYGILDLNSLAYEQISISYDFDKLKEYYVTSKYFKENKIWANLIVHYNIICHLPNTKVDPCSGFVRFVIERAKKEGINIEDGIPNRIWNSSFEMFMNKYNLEIYEHK